MKFSVFLFVLLLGFPASAAPDKTLIKVNYYPDEISYIHKNKTVKCSQNKQGGVILGCARDKKKITISIDCDKRLILVNVFSTNREIEIHADLKKNSCEYQEVLDHELTHMDLHVEALENILNKGMSDIVDAFNARYNNGNGCKAAIAAARQAFDAFVQKYMKEDRRINQEFDRDDVDSVLHNCKTPPKVNFSYNQAKVKYVPSNQVACLRKKMKCSQINGKSKCEPMKMLSCTDMPISFKWETRPYLAQIDVSILAPEIQTKISSRFQPNSCRYQALKDYELGLIDGIEDALYGFMDGVEPAIKQVYNQALQNEVSGKELAGAVDGVLHRYIQQAQRHINYVEAAFKPLTEEELKNKCERK